MQFYSPLTVIVGHNGSGKTTIIECLKYATTGDLPPNTKGGAFVHDPAMAGERESKAEVKLRFKNSNGERLVVTRKLQVTAKKGAASHTMKTLENTLSYADEKGDSNKRRTLSTKCAELDEELPIQLGVSKAILENVIFCHQEDSNWPLSEPAALKKKFDEIFEATKYTKALDQIKAIRKEQTAEVKVEKERLVALKTDRERARKLTNSIDKTTVDLSGKRTEHEELDVEIRELYTHNQSFYDQATRAESIVNQGATLTTKMETVSGSMQSMLLTMKTLNDSDADLQDRLTNYQQHVNEHAEKVRGRQRDLQSENQKINQTRTRLASQQQLLGQAQSDKARHESNIKNRQNLVLTLAGKHSIDGFNEIPIDEQQIDDFSSQINAEQRKAEAKLSDFTDRKNAEESAQNDEINKLKAQALTAGERRNAVKSQIAAHRKEISSLSARIEDSRVSESDIQVKEQSIEDSKKRIAAMKKTIADAKYDERLRSLAAEQRENEAERDALLKELATLSKQADARVRLGVKRQEREEKEEAIQKILERTDAKFRKYAGTAPSSSNMDADLNAALRDKENELVGAERAQNSANREFQQIDAKVSYASKQIDKLKVDLESLKAQVANATENRRLDEALAEAEEEAGLRKKDLELIGFSAKFYQRIIDQSRKDHSCMACRRHLRDFDMAKLEEHCNDQIATAPQKKKDLEGELVSWREEVTKLRGVQPLEISATKIQDAEIPQVQSELEQARGKQPAAAAAQEAAKKKVDALKADIRELNLLKRPANDVARLTSEVKAAQDQISRIEAELAITGSTETAEDVQVKVSAASDKLRKCGAAIQEATADREKQRSGLGLLEANFYNAERDLSKLASEFKERQSLEKRRSEAQKSMEEREAAVVALEEDARKSSEPIRKREDAFSQMKRENADQIRQMSKSLSNLQADVSALAAASKDIANFAQSDAANRVEEIQQQIKELTRQIEKMEQQARAIQADISKLEREGAEAEQVKRNVSDNLAYRRKEKEMQNLDNELKGLNIKDAEKAARRFHQEYEESRKKQSDMQGRQNRLAGEIEMLKASLKDKEAELKTEYDNIKTEYRNQLIKVKVTELALLDLEKYGKALDTAIMKYHEHKMQEINDSIQGLWTKTYQGNDIDKIMIKSDAEGATKTGRSYNYRVVMLKDTVEMDMRGRCSAGQKVLASIIIRLALAESFGTNCGILALDEPTTNLDKDNIQSLASALADIIRERRGQSNFQLVVITHDEDLLQELSRSDVVEKFFRVSRNNRSKSEITRERVSDLQ